jgi:glutamate-ammonia-ligase adenylyltransferase
MTVARAQALPAARILPGGRTDAAALLLAGGASDSPIDHALVTAFAHAPYLMRLGRTRPDLVGAIRSQGWSGVAEDAIALAQAAAAEPESEAAVMARLRRAKAACHLALAVGDLSGEADLDAVTGGLTRFADAAIAAALAHAWTHAADKGQLAVDPHEAGAQPGLCLIAMGKAGAFELNYSSDVDFTCFYDSATLPVRPCVEPRRAALLVVEQLVAILERRTADGYVLRTDLRLRPDPGSTAPAVAFGMAERYYESVGQNWERAALIKARPMAGDLEAGSAFLAGLVPFVWRRHLDYAAIADITSIRRQILGGGAGRTLDETACDVKLGRGGIREIELFVQTQQLILGGRDPSLRSPRTLEALAALTSAGALPDDVRGELARAYGVLRAVEHRIQMLEDEQTHRVPADAGVRTDLAALCGLPDAAAFDTWLSATRRSVAHAVDSLFGGAQPLGDSAGGALVFTGVEDDPETLQTLRAMGYREPARVTQTVRGWHHGRIRATRTPRAREILTAIKPRLLRALADTGGADQAFVRFDQFLSGLNAGVQTLALLEARPEALAALARLLAVAPRLADVLARRPDLIDAALDPRMALPVSEESDTAILEAACAQVSAAGDFADALDRLRRLRREEGFRIGLQVLEGRIGADVAAKAQSRLAEACVEAVARAAVAELGRTAGAPPGRWVLVALGKLGGREIGPRSDLDLMLVYDAAEGARSDGPMPLDARDWFTRFLQRLTAGLSAPTAEGILYEVDLQLRPSGKQGPVAVRIESFERYYAAEAWTWELMALTRARPVVGDPALAGRVAAAVRSALTVPRDAHLIRRDAADMRARLSREKPSRGGWDLKRRPGGLVDIEFAAQVGQLLHAPHLQAIRPDTAGALEQLRAGGWLEAEGADALCGALARLSAARQVLDLAIEGPLDPAAAPAALAGLLARTLNAPDLADAQRVLDAVCSRAALHVAAMLATETPVGGVQPPEVADTPRPAQG